MKLFTNLDHEVISLDLYTLVMPSLTSVHSLFGFDFCSWHVEQCPLPSDSNMFWISPGNDTTFSHLLGHLGSGDIESVLRGICSVSGPEVNSLVIFNLIFGVLSYCQSQPFHIDYMRI